MALVPHREAYEHLGEVEAGVHDLGAAFRAIAIARHVAVAPEEFPPLAPRGGAYPARVPLPTEERGPLPDGFADRIERNVRRLEAQLAAGAAA
jgi:hypothetical protein